MRSSPLLDFIGLAAYMAVVGAGPPDPRVLVDAVQQSAGSSQDAGPKGTIKISENLPSTAVQGGDSCVSHNRAPQDVQPEMASGGGRAGVRGLHAARLRR